MPLVVWSREAGLPHATVVGGRGLELDRAEHAQGAVAALAVVEDLQVGKDGVGQLEAGPPALPVQQLDLHAGPERPRS